MKVVAYSRCNVATFLAAIFRDLNILKSKGPKVWSIVRPRGWVGMWSMKIGADKNTDKIPDLIQLN